MLELLAQVVLPDPTAILYTAQAGTYAALAATPADAHSHRRIALCHWLSAGIYVGFAVLHILARHC